MTYVLVAALALAAAVTVWRTWPRPAPPEPPAPPPAPVARVRVGGPYVTQRVGPGVYTGRLTPKQIRQAQDWERSHLPTAKD